MPGPNTSEPHSPTWTVAVLDIHGTWNDVKKIGSILLAELMTIDMVSGSVELPSALKDFPSEGGLGSATQTSLTIRSGSPTWAATGTCPETMRIDEHFSVHSIECTLGQGHITFETSAGWEKVHITETGQLIHIRVPPTAVLPTHGIEWSEEFPIDLRCPACLEYKVGIWFPCSTNQSVHGLCTNCYFRVGLCEVDLVLCPYCRKKSSWLDIIPRVKPVATQTEVGNPTQGSDDEVNSLDRARGVLFVAVLRQLVAELRMAESTATDGPHTEKASVSTVNTRILHHFWQLLRH